MKQSRAATALVRQAGVGMVELMVAMLLGAMVVVGVVQIFTANKQSFRMQDGMALTQETGTFALDFIVRDLLRAGFPGFPGSTDAFDWVNTINDDAGGNDRIAVVYGPDAANGVYCTGEAVGGALRISNRYWVEDGELLCQGAAQDPATGLYEAVGTPLALADNVESFQIAFGVDLEHDRDPTQEPVPVATCPDSLQLPSAYVTANLVPAAIARGAAPPVCKSDMTALEVVRSVRIGLLMSTDGDAGAIVDPARTFTVLDKAVGTPDIDPADGRLRRVFTKTVGLRNVGETVE